MPAGWAAGGGPPTPRQNQILRYKLNEHFARRLCGVTRRNATEQKINKRHYVRVGNGEASVVARSAERSRRVRGLKCRGAGGFDRRALSKCGVWKFEIEKLIDGRFAK